jgi:hypothetical protein
LALPGRDAFSRLFGLIGPLAELYTVHDGKVVYRKGFSDPDEALEAVGLSD